MKKLLLLLLFVPLVSCDKDISINPSEENNNLPATVVFKNIPGGTFTMGGTTIQEDAPEVNVTLTGFQISEKEITNEQYIDFLNNANLDGWITVSVQSIADPCGTYSEKMVVGAENAPHTGEIFLQLAETGGCTSSGEAEHIYNKSWISFDNISNTFELLDIIKADWPVNWVKWFGADAYVQYYNVSLPTEA